MKIILTIIASVLFLGMANFSMASEGKGGYGKAVESVKEKASEKMAKFKEEKAKIMDSDITDEAKEKAIKMLKEKFNIK